MRDLERVGRQEQQIEDQQRQEARPWHGRATSPSGGAPPVDQRASYHHGRRHRDAVGRRQPLEDRKPSTRPSTRPEQQPVHQRRCRSARPSSRGVADRHARQVAQLDRLGVSENAPEISACEAMTVAAVASATSGSRPLGRQQEERILDRLRIGKHQRALAEVVEHRAPASRRRTRRRGSAARPKWPMSAYSASPPVTARKTAAETRKPASRCPRRTHGA